MGVHNAKRFTSILPIFFFGGGRTLLLSVYFGLFAISLLSADCETRKKCTVTSRESFLLKALQFDGFLSSMLKHIGQRCSYFHAKEAINRSIISDEKTKKNGRHK